MTLEAMNRYGWPAAGIVRRLRRHPGEIRQLVLFRQALDEFPRFGVQVLMITPQLLWSARQLSQQIGLLSGDALIVALMQSNGLTQLASSDADFDRVPGLSRYAPV